MPLPWYYPHLLLNDRPAELRQEADNVRRAKEAQGDAASIPVLPPLFSWLKEKVGALRQPINSWASPSKTLASQQKSYLDNPDPFKDCVTC